MRNTFLVAAMLFLSLTVAGCANTRDAANRGNGTTTPGASVNDAADYSADADGAVNEADRDTAVESKNNIGKKQDHDDAATAKDNTVADNSKNTVDKVTDDVESAADNVTDAADNVVDGAADAVKGATDTVTDAANDEMDAGEQDR